MRDPVPSSVSEASSERTSSVEEHEVPSEVPFDHLEDRVDHVISNHGVVEAELDSSVRSTLRSVGFTERVGHYDAPKIVPRAWDPNEFHHDEAMLLERRRRESALRDLRPDVVRPHLEAPLVTRGGVFYVPPEFFQARGLDRRMDALIIRSGIRSVRAFLESSDYEIAQTIGIPMREVARAKDDLDLTRLPGIDGAAAEILRLAGIQSGSRLAAAEPLLLFDDIARLCKRHRFLDLPPALASLDRIQALIDDAQGQA